MRGPLIERSRALRRQVTLCTLYFICLQSLKCRQHLSEENLNHALMVRFALLAHATSAFSNCNIFETDIKRKH